MKNRQDEYAMDGSFEIEDGTIYYRITDNTKPIRMVKGVEKMSRYISFYKENGEHIGTTSIYDTYERMSNITHFDAKEWYKEYKKCERKALLSLPLLNIIKTANQAHRYSTIQLC